MKTKQASTTVKSASDPARQTSEEGKTKLMMAIACLAIVAVGALVANWFTSSAPEARKRPPVKIVPLVRVQKVHPQTQTVVVNAMGTVIPAQELILKSRVAGEIVTLHPEFTEGGVFRKGQIVVQIDDLDYQLIVAQKRSAVADASFNLKLELGRQDVAQREWSLLNGDNPTPEADAELALRKPHLDKARSDLEAAQAELEAANLQLARTKIRAPFNAVVRSTDVAYGSMVAAQEPLATLAGTDQYWVQVSVPVDRLPWIAVPENRTQAGANVQVRYQGDAKRDGRVEKLLSDLEEKGRMARLVIAVGDPLGLHKSADAQPAMLIGEYVRVAIQGRDITSAYRIPREALRDNTYVWVADSENHLAIRKVEILWRDTETVVLKKGLQPADRVVVSDLATPIAGMAVQVENNGPDPIKPASSPVQQKRQG